MKRRIGILAALAVSLLAIGAPVYAQADTQAQCHWRVVNGVRSCI